MSVMPPEEPDIVGEDDPRARWWAAHRGLTTVGLAVVLAAVVVIVAVVVPRHQPAKAASPETATTSVTNNPSPATLSMFAQGTATAGGQWDLAVANVATDGRSCLPAVVLSDQIADVLFPDPDLGLTPAGAPSALTGVPQTTSATESGASFAFFRVPAAVRQLRVTIGTAAPLTLTPRNESECGQAFRLAGFGFPSAARVTVTAITGQDKPASYVLPSTLVHPPRHTPGYGAWENLSPAERLGTPEVVAAANIDGERFAMAIAISTDGECFHLTSDGQPVPGVPILCAPITLPNTDAPTNVLRVPFGPQGYFLTVTDTVRLVTMTLPGGKTMNATPVDVYGVLFAGMFTGTTPAKFAFYRVGGSVISSIPWSTAPVKSPVQSPVKSQA
jgi:hypothetical protein